MVGHVAGEFGRPARGAHACGLQAVLDCHRQTVQRPDFFASREAAVGLPGLRASPLSSHRHHRAQARVQRLDPVQVALHQLGAGDLLAPDRGGQLSRRPERQLRHVSPFACRPAVATSVPDRGRATVAPRPGRRVAPRPLGARSRPGAADLHSACTRAPSRLHAGRMPCYGLSNSGGGMLSCRRPAGARLRDPWAGLGGSSWSSRDRLPAGLPCRQWCSQKRR